MNSTTGTGRPAPLTRAQRTRSRRFRLWSWRASIHLVALTLVIAGGVLFARELRGGDEAPQVTVAANHLATLNENIAFWESRAAEIGDHLSLNQLTTLYLQRLRETGDTSDIARAELAATRSLEVFPDAYTGTVNLALVRIAQHDFTGALELANRARQAKPLAPDAHAVAGDAELALGQYDAATTSYRTFLDIAPGFDALIRQAALAEVRGNLPLAGQFWEAAIDVAGRELPENAAWSRVQYGTLLATTGDLGAAHEQFASALRTYPGMAAAHAGLGRVAAMRGDDREAIAQYSAAIDRLPVLEHVVALGEVYERTGDTTAAGRQYALAGGIAELLAAHGVRNDLAVIAFELDHGADPASVVPAAETAYADRPSTAAADTLAWAYYRAGRIEDAGRLSREALTLGTKDPLLFYHGGMIALAAGDTARARDLLSAALALNPAFSVSQAPVAKAALASLEGGAR